MQNKTPSDYDAVSLRTQNQNDPIECVKAGRRLQQELADPRTETDSFDVAVRVGRIVDALEELIQERLKRK